VTFTYDTAHLATSDLYRLRFELGDTDSNSVLLQDEEIQFCLSKTGSFYRAAYMAANVVANKFAREAGFGAGPLRVELAQRAKQWEARAEHFLRQAQEESATVGGPEAGGMPDPDRGPEIYRGMHDYPVWPSPNSSWW
jgi:hypothetical protein